MPDVCRKCHNGFDTTRAYHWDQVSNTSKLVEKITSPTGRKARSKAQPKQKPRADAEPKVDNKLEEVLAPSETLGFEEDAVVSTLNNPH